ncbi:DUF58 domain-containing protein [Methanolobus vulcani]|jgi:uncharacterized protein (DUF58 family)|uniref:DUF58 domain-containing protein n=1 Tax=Methanolobus vulcani TaxID=38026 RepID=A0A7Z8KM70_9EURY|nr:DUF58 domain-containing protein [Methanolobus vulcani]TQD23522.1 DUF58 domain-containing protein [Methanolobus vulcani]
MSDKRHNIDVEFFRQLDRFTFMVKKRISTAYAGSRRSIHSGRGLDTKGYREYDSGDEIKTIDWKVYARSEKLYIRQFEEDKSLTTHILLDSSKSMDYTSGDAPSKFEYATMLASGFAYLVTKDNDKFAISTFAEDVNITKPRRGRKYLLKTIERLETAPVGGKTAIDESTLVYSKVIHSRSLVIIISDFLQDPKEIESAIYRLSDHDLILVQVLDRTESSLEIHGHSRLIDLESGSKLDTYVSEDMKNEYQKKLTEHVGHISDVCNKVGAEFYSFTTDTPIFDAFFNTISRGK